MTNRPQASEQQIVARMDIDNDTFTEALIKVAIALDARKHDTNWPDFAIYIRHASNALASHIYYNSAPDFTPIYEDTAKTDVPDHHVMYELFESRVAKNDQPQKSFLIPRREIFELVGNQGAHPNNPATLAKIAKAFDAILSYAERWVTLFANEKHKKISAYKDPHLDEITTYRTKAEKRLANLMDDVSEDCLLDRKVSFKPRPDKSAESDDEDEIGNEGDTLGLWSAQKERNARDVAQQGTPSTAEVLISRKQSLVLAQAGMGKSLEASRLAVQLTNVKGDIPHSCCVVLECRLFKVSIAETFAASSSVVPSFKTFCALQGWPRYLILDGFDELDRSVRNTTKFFNAVSEFQRALPDVNILITSRDSTAVTTSFPEWEAYELLEVDRFHFADYLLKRIQHKKGIGEIQRLADQITTLAVDGHIFRLLQVPFFLNAFVETVMPSEEITNTSRYKILESFVSKLLKRQLIEKQGWLLDDVNFDEKFNRILKEFGIHAFHIATNQQHPASQDLKNLASLDFLLRTDDFQFKQAVVRDYFAAHFLFNNPSDENFNFLAGLEDEQRFAFHGWLLEHVNDKELETDNRKKVRNWLWENDLVLVSLGLFSEKQLKEFKLPDNHWEPYEIGLMKIMRGESAKYIPETCEIRDVRLASPGEKLLHRLRQPDLPYFIRAVPQLRAINHLRKAWSAAADPWGEFMSPLAPIAKDWLEWKYGANAPVALYAFGIDQPDDIIDKAAQYAITAIENDFETEALVRLLLLLVDLLTKVGYEKKKEQINEGINNLRHEIFKRRVSAKQLHRLLSSETRHKVKNGICSNRALSFKALKFIYAGNLQQPPTLYDVKMKALIVEIKSLCHCFGNDEQATNFAKQLLSLVSNDVKSIAPVTLAAAIATRIAILTTLQDSGWLERWIEVWWERLSAYEAITLQQRRISLHQTPPGFVDAGGWLQARDAVKLARMYWGALPSPQYTLEQKQHWVATASLQELSGLLYRGVIAKCPNDGVFVEAVRRLETTSRPQHWWQLVRAGKLAMEDIESTVTDLLNRVRDDPVAYELLEGAGWHVEKPSEKVVELVAQGKDCPSATRLHLINRGKVSVEACWKSEGEYLKNHVFQMIAEGKPVIGLNDEPISIEGGFLTGHFLLIWHAGAGKSYFSHPTADFISKSELVSMHNLDNGQVICGYLWITVDSINRTYTLSVRPHRRGYHPLKKVFENGKVIDKPLPCEERQTME